MKTRKAVKPVALAVGAALAGSFAMSGVASADTGASPFAMTTLSAGYMLGAGEGACGGDKGGDKAKTEGNCGGDKEAEGNCGGDKEDKDAEGSCGGDKEEKDAEGKCGEGKCGGAV
ncbi:MAG TPA: low-complexity protein [Woeseiaceae bacterium]|nr:low-complexity protein [Woeseiaceae bacterium]